METLVQQLGADGIEAKRQVGNAGAVFYKLPYLCIGYRLCTFILFYPRFVIMLFLFVFVVVWNYCWLAAWPYSLSRGIYSEPLFVRI